MPKSSTTQRIQAQLKKVPLWVLGLFIVLLAILIMIFQYKILGQKLVTDPYVIIIGDSNSDPTSITQVRKWSEDYVISRMGTENVINLSIGGHAVEDFDQKVELAQLKAAAAKIPSSAKIIVICLLGTNNTVMMQKLDTSDQFIGHYTQYLEHVTEILKPDSIIIASIPPAFPNPATPVPFTPNFKAYKLITLFNLDLENWVKTKQHISGATLNFVSLFPDEAYQANNMDTYLIVDGIHWNRNSQQLVLQKIHYAVQKQLAP